MLHAEEAEQKALIHWARLMPLKGDGVAFHATIGDYLIAYPNGGKRLYTEAARLHGLGVKKGVVDLLLPLSRLGYHGLWIEMKKPLAAFRSSSAARDAVTSEQRCWMVRMRQAAYAATACYGWDAARVLIEAYVQEGDDFVALYEHFWTLLDKSGQ